MKTRRAGQPCAPTPLRARRAVEVSARAAPEPGRGVAIRGLAELVDAELVDAELVDAERPTEPGWRETWAEEIAEREARSGAR